MAYEKKGAIEQTGVPKQAKGTVRVTVEGLTKDDPAAHRTARQYANLGYEVVGTDQFGGIVMDAPASVATDLDKQRRGLASSRMKGVLKETPGRNTYKNDSEETVERMSSEPPSDLGAPDDES